VGGPEQKPSGKSVKSAVKRALSWGRAIDEGFVMKGAAACAAPAMEFPAVMLRSFLVRLALVAGACVATVAVVSANPAQVILLSHAEKPPTGSELNEAGNQRATALAGLFQTDPRVRAHGPVAAIFAMEPPDANGSVRPIRTMAPTAAALHLPIDTRFKREEVKALAKAIRKDKTLEGKTVVICWEHKMIPEIVAALGWSNPPAQWRDGVYDRLWVLDFEGGVPVAFHDLPQKLLPGDSGR
jgi:hypothetical protein